MRVAISNIAWDLAEDEAVATLLQDLAIDAIDIAPGKYFPQPALATDEQILSLRGWWAERGIEITGMQALLFGTVGLNVFGTPEVRAALLAHLGAVCRIAGVLGARWLVFGSPKNRDRSALDDEQTQVIATQFFRDLGDIAQRHGVVICLEPNPPCYGANFMIDSVQTASVVRQVNHPAIRMQIDTGAITINGDDPLSVIAQYADIVGHVHASERDLLPLGNGDTDHAQMAAAVAQYLPSKVVTVEMIASQNEPHLQAIERALHIATAHYRGAAGRVSG